MLKPYCGGFYFQSHPFARLGQRTHIDLFSRAFISKTDGVLVPPIGPVIPIISMELKHDGFGRVLRIQVNIGKKSVAGSHCERFCAFFEINLVDTFAGASNGPLATEYRAFAPSA